MASTGVGLVAAQTTTDGTATDGTITGGTTETVDLPRPAWIPEWLPQWLIDLVVAVALLVAAWYASKLLTQLLSRRIARRFRRPSLTQTVLRSIRVSVMVLAVLAAMNVVGLRIGNIVLSVTVFSAVLGFVLAPIIGSVINGVFVLSEHAYEIGDMVELSDRNQRGFVEDITLRYTKIFTLDNTFLVIPNENIRDRDVINYSAEDERIRLSLDVLVTYESDVDLARERIEDAARKCEGVIRGGPDIRIGSARYPASPTCYINEFADHGVLLTLRYWGKEPYKLLTLRSRVQTAIRERFEEERDLEFAYPHQHHVFDETSGELPVAVRENGGDGAGRPVDTADGEDEAEREGSQGPS